MNHCTSGRDIDIGPLGMTVMTRTGPRFSFSTNSGALQSFMFCCARQHVLAGLQAERPHRVLQPVGVGRRRQLAAVPERRHVNDRARDEDDHR